MATTEHSRQTYTILRLAGDILLGNLSASASRDLNRCKLFLVERETFSCVLDKSRMSTATRTSESVNWPTKLDSNFEHAFLTFEPLFKMCNAFARIGSSCVTFLSNVRNRLRPMAENISGTKPRDSVD